MSTIPVNSALILECIDLLDNYTDDCGWCNVCETSWNAKTLSDHKPGCRVEKALAELRALLEDQNGPKSNR